MFVADSRAVREFCTHLCLDSLVEKFGRMSDFEFGICLKALCGSSEEIGGRLCDKLELRRIEAFLNEMNPDDVMICLTALRATNPDKSEAIFRALSLGEMARRVAGQDWQVETLARLLNAFRSGHAEEHLEVITDVGLRTRISNHLAKLRTQSLH